MFKVLKQKINIHYVFETTTTPGNLHCKRKPTKDVWNSTHFVSSVPFGQAPEQYRSGGANFSTIELDSTNVNRIPYHFAIVGHNFPFEQTKIIAREKKLFRRSIIEGIHICNKEQSWINIIAGQRIDASWKHILNIFSTKRVEKGLIAMTYSV